MYAHLHSSLKGGAEGDFAPPFYRARRQGVSLLPATRQLLPQKPVLAAAVL